MGGHTAGWGGKGLAFQKVLSVYAAFERHSVTAVL